MFSFNKHPFNIHRQLEALDKELQQLSQIKENVEDKVCLRFGALHTYSLKPGCQHLMWYLVCVYQHLMWYIVCVFCSVTVGAAEEAVPCPPQYDPGTTADAGE